MSTVKFVDQISDAIEAKMRKDLVDYESSHGIDVNFKKFALVLYDDNEEVIGVLNAFTAFSEVYIDDLWVDSAHRGKGHGRSLLKELEDHFKGQGFNNMNLVTNQFNAPEFYKKCGFQAEFIRQNLKNPQLTKTFFIKFFEDEVQHQGLLQKSKITQCT
jgi:ribosomal protein S18 acetylase RimI-like enzyme